MIVLMTNTPNHNYKTPSEGTTDWHIPLNENFEQLDVDIEIRGPEANKGEYEPKTGSKYEASDSGAVYYGNGDTWVLADRRVSQLQAGTVSTKQIQNNGPRIVSPSIDAGYNSLQTAIDDAAEGKSSTIWVAENIKENVVIPRDDEAEWYNRGLIIKGVSDQQTIIEDKAKDGQTPVITGSDSSAQLHRLTLENLHITGNKNSGPAVSLPKSCPFFTMIQCATDMPCEVGSPFFSYFERCYFNSVTSIETHPQIGVTNNTVTTDSPMILDGGNLVRIDRCTFRADTGETNFALLWLCQINNIEMNQPEFKIVKARYDQSAPRPVASLLIDGACGDINMNSPYCENLMDTHFRTARTPLTETGSPRSIFMRNARFGHFTIDQMTAGLFIEVDGAGVQERTIVANAPLTSGSYFKTPANHSVTLQGDVEKLPIVINSDIEPTTPSLPSATGESNSIQNPNPFHCLVYHNGAGTEVVAPGNDYKGAYIGGPTVVRKGEYIYYTESIPTEWNWIKFPSI